MEDIVLAIIKGAYKINDLHIDKIDSATMKIIPFINADEIGIAVEWNSLLKGKFVGEPGFLPFPQALKHMQILMEALNLKMKLGPLSKSPTFDLNVAMENTSLVELNDSSWL